MAGSKRQAWIVSSFALLTTAFVVAAYALHVIRLHALPIPMILSAFTLAFPVIAGLATEIASSLGRRKSLAAILPAQHQIRLSDNRQTANLGPDLLTFTTYALTVLATTLAALVGPYIGPVDSLSCGLETRWRHLFQAKNAQVIQLIQDAFNCCGLHAPLDMAWPFPAKNVPPNTCQNQYNRPGSCFAPWRSEERKVAGLILGVVGVVYVWMIVSVLLLRRSNDVKDSWQSRAQGRIEGEDAERDADLNTRGGLLTANAGQSYRDEPEEDNNNQNGAVRSGTTARSAIEAEPWAH